MKPMYLTLLPVLGLGFATMEVQAEAWPTKPLRAIVPVGAGSTTDIIPRVVFEQPVQAVVPDQFAVFYWGERVLGGGLIRRAETLHAQPAQVTP